MLYSDTLRKTLAHEVIGQPRAVDGVVRGVTRVISGLTPVERSWCAYLFIGPPGTGRAHLVRTLARVLHGDEILCTLDCNPAGHADSWLWFVEQLMPLFLRQEADRLAGREGVPHVVLIRDLEKSRKEIFPALARFLETGQVVLPGGRRGTLERCLVFLTSSVCSAEILESGRIGFSGGPREGEEPDEDAIFNVCRTEAENVFGLDLLAQLDNVIVFRRLEEEHLATILERHFERMGRWLFQRGVRCELRPAARRFLLERGMRQRLLGARDLILAHRQEVEFPLADLLLSGQVLPGGCIAVDHRPGEDHLHFRVEDPEEVQDDAFRALGGLEVPIGA